MVADSNTVAFVPHMCKCKWIAWKTKNYLPACLWFWNLHFVFMYTDRVTEVKTNIYVTSFGPGLRYRHGEKSRAVIHVYHQQSICPFCPPVYLTLLLLFLSLRLSLSLPYPPPLFLISLFISLLLTPSPPLLISLFISPPPPPVTPYDLSIHQQSGHFFPLESNILPRTRAHGSTWPFTFITLHGHLEKCPRGDYLSSYWAIDYGMDVISAMCQCHGV